MPTAGIEVTQVYLAAVATTETLEEPGLSELIFQAGPVVQMTLLVLVAMSLFCWIIIFNKLAVLRRAAKNSRAFLYLFWKSRRLDQVYERSGRLGASPVGAVFQAGYIELSKLSNQERDTSNETIALGGEENLARALRRAATVERTNLQRMTTFLATTGSTAPFIGLFGTVWGILMAFQKIGATGQASLSVVGPDIAHALIATAIGLAAAIPAVMAYNYFNARIRVLNDEMSNFSSDFLNIVKRHFGNR